MFFVMANKLTTAAIAIVLQYAAPVFILIMTSLIFKQKLHRKENNNRGHYHGRHNSVFFSISFHPVIS